ncbi:hypothetical protein VaNZ11_009807 [Volvox africanus]|uniref:Membrane bound O-acyl transferase n=1 Tax=Volvox africanus TaxID=51714 RepID=A0ABQ5S849_9CHLO|nr:hypothetical protein VaNZ11_009807 [Volvox africanus]
MERRDRFLLAERLIYLALVAGLQLNVLREGYHFAKKVQSIINLPGLRDEGPYFGRNDLSDYQWRSFRDSAPLLAAAMVTFIALSQLARVFPRIRQAVMVALSMVFLCAVHGACAAYVIALTGASYLLSRRLAGRPYGLLGVWVYGCATLLLARLSEGLPFAWISPRLAPLDHHRGLLRWHIHYNLMMLRFISFASDLHAARRGKRTKRSSGDSSGPLSAAGTRAGVGAGAGSELGARCSPEEEDQRTTSGETTEERYEPHLASRGGYGAAAAGGGAAAGDRGGSSFVNDELRALTDAPLPLPYYSLLPFLEYVLYPPLYIAGPIITFNSFAAQRMLKRQSLLGPRQVLAYALRAALAWGCLEGLTHALPYNSIAKHRVLDRLAAAATAAMSRSGGSDVGRLPPWAPQPVHYAITGYWVLIFMWLKFTVIWRFFRLVSLLDGVVPPENMTRCVCNNYDIEGFWRSWHASYNRWLVRYMYVPMGGSRWRAANVWVIFTFVALWHDLEWRLLGWAWLMAAAVAPEMVAKALGRSAAVRRWYGTATFRLASSLAAAANILVLMVANLVGFVVGLDGIVPLAQQVLLKQPAFLGVVFLALFAAVQLMFWKREWEGSAAGTRARAAVGMGAGGGGGG